MKINMFVKVAAGLMLAGSMAACSAPSPSYQVQGAGVAQNSNEAAASPNSDGQQVNDVDQDKVIPGRVVTNKDPRKGIVKVKYGQRNLTIYKFCDGANLIYMSDSSKDKAVNQVFADSPECR